MLVGVIVQVSPVTGEITSDRFVVPPAGLDMLRVEVPDAPANTVTLVGLAVMLSPDVTV